MVNLSLKLLLIHSIQEKHIITTRATLNFGLLHFQQSGWFVWMACITSGTTFVGRMLTVCVTGGATFVDRMLIFCVTCGATFVDGLFDKWYKLCWQSVVCLCDI